MTDPDIPRDLLHVATDVTDAVSVDWLHVPELDVPDDPSLSRILGGLETIERIFVAHRTLAPARQPLPAPHFVWGPLHVYEQIGQGTFGRVFRAWDPRLEIEVALKLFRRASGIDAMGARDMLAEARGLARIRHPAVVVVHGADIHDGEIGLWVDYVCGRTLEERLVDGALPIGTVVEIGVTLCQALAAVHDAGFAHGDIKAANVIERPDGPVVLTDFGSCVAFSAADDVSLALTGTPLSMAPELFDGAAPSPASDVYALGALLFRLLSGRHPIEGDSAGTIALEHRRGRRPQLRQHRSDVPAPLVRALDRALAGQAALRFQTMAAFEAELARGAVPDHNLPRPAGSFVGRELERRTLATRLRGGHLLTVTGVGGGGKSRLALQVAHDVLADFADGVFWIELTAVHPTGVVTAIGDVVGLQDADAPPEAIADVLGERRVLIVLDNCEHVLDAVAEIVSAIRARCPHTALLATTRQVLSVEGEEHVLLDPMPVDAAVDEARPDELESLDCVRLFAERARAVRPDFALTPGVATVVARICRRLDGLPLAIELAAAGTRVMALGDIERRLGERLPALGGRGKASRPHHATLEATFAWSYEPLTETQQLLLRRLAACADGWQLETALALGDSDVPDAIDVHAHLIERSLVAVEHASDGVNARYRLLDTVATYVRGKCSGEELPVAERALTRHFVASLTELGAARGEDATASRWLAFVDAELDNVRTLLRHLLERREIEAVGALLHAVRHYWHRRLRHPEACAFYRHLWPLRDTGWTDAISAENWCAAGVLAMQLDRHGEAESYLEDVRAGVARGAPAKYDIWALQNLGAIRMSQGDLDAAAELYDQSLARGRQLDDRSSIATALGALARVHAHRQDLEQADANLMEAEALFRELGSGRNVALCLRGRGMHAMFRGDRRQARGLLEEAARLQRQLELSQDIKNTLSDLGDLHAEEGDLERARECAEEMLTHMHAGGSPDPMAHLMLGGLARLAGDPEAAERHFVDCLRPELGAFARLGGPALEGLAAIVLDQQRHTDVAWMLGAASHLTRGFDDMWDPARSRTFATNEAVAEQARSALGPQAFDRAWKEGERMTFEQAAARAIEAWALSR